MTVNVTTRPGSSETKYCRRRYFYRDLRIWRDGRRNGRAGDGEMGGARTGGNGARGWEQLNGGARVGAVEWRREDGVTDP